MKCFLTAEEHDTGLIRDLDPKAPSLEGYLFPDTYKLAPNMTPDQILGEMVAHFRQEAQRLGLTQNIPATVTLASLVERETPVGTDRPMVASVFQNRLAQNMPLDTDPSVIYAALLEKRYRGTIYASDLKAQSPYNTYTHTGLPPGPICNPGIPSLEAAMHPAQTNFLYFVSDPSNPGHSRFAATLEEHEKNVAAYRKAQPAQQPGDGKIILHRLLANLRTLLLGSRAPAAPATNGQCPAGVLALLPLLLLTGCLKHTRILERRRPLP